MAKKKAIKTELQRFAAKVVARKDLNLASYNPRMMDEDARERLLENVKRVGLIEFIIVNETTGNVLGGHQRIEALDALEKNQDYSLEVAVVKLTPEEEKAQIIFMNNELAQGDYDATKLGTVLAEIDPLNTGFKFGELEAMIPDWTRPAPEPAKTPELSKSVLIVFRDRAQNDKFMELLHLSAFEKYVSGETIAELVRSVLISE